jgi:thiol-disulfide isomerase/thioredoxin
MKKSTALLLVFMCSLGLQAQQNLKLGEQAPAINITSWIENVPEDKELTNRFIVLEFWATWCGPCLGAVPHVNELVKEFQPEILFISLTNEAPVRVERTLKRTPFLSAVATDETGFTNNAYGDGKSQYTALPMAVLIDNKNVIKWIGKPYDLTREALQLFLNGTLEEKNDFENYGDFTNELEEASFKSFLEEIKLLKKSTLDYFFELKAVKKSDDHSVIKGGLLYGNSNVSLQNFFSQLLAIPYELVSVPEVLENNEYRILYKSKNPTVDLNTDLLNDAINKLGLKMQTEKASRDGHILTLKDTTMLHVTLEVNTLNRSDIYDPKRPKVQGTVYKNINIKDLLLDLSTSTGNYLVMDAVPDGKYDFTVETGTISDIKRSLESYGFHLEASKITLEKIVFKQR